jgi:hypothetical protein
LRDKKRQRWRDKPAATKEKSRAVLQRGARMFPTRPESAIAKTHPLQKPPRARIELRLEGCATRLAITYFRENEAFK